MIEEPAFKAMMTLSIGGGAIDYCLNPWHDSMDTCDEVGHVSSVLNVLSVWHGR